MEQLVNKVRNMMAQAYSEFQDREYLPVDYFTKKFVDQDEFVKLGSGCFSYVYKHIKTGLAVKITGLNGDLDGYPDYVEFIRNNPSLKHLPKIHHFEYLNDDKDCFFTILPVYEQNKLSLTKIDEIEDIITKGKPKDLGLKWNDSLNETCLAMNYLSKIYGSDLYLDNIMTGEDGEPILTDPFAFKKS